jgi:hypothetical protein
MLQCVIGPPGPEESEDMLTPMEASDIKTPDPGRALKMGMGLASPLWPVFVATAGAGVAYWWMARWIQVEDRSFAPADPAFPLGPPAELADAVQQAYAEPIDEAYAAAEDMQADTVEAVQEMTAEAAAAGEAALDQASETAEAMAEQSLAAADAATEAVQDAAEQVSDQAAEVAAAAPKPQRVRREKPVD